ncbi:MAG: SdiA-regulated domain-containing protein [Bacteroidetes bacterium]|nr:SdiA-regulated domain-containing protein [Bacteroidota bacterium]
MLQMSFSSRWFLPALVLVLLGCDQLTRKEGKKQALEIPYDLENPSEFILDDELHEISGISPLADGKSLAAINDETGKLYFLDLEGNILKSKWFHKGGDYEDIAVVGNGLYIMKSNGNLYFIEDYAADSIDSQTIKARLKDGIEIESLTYDEAADKLLLLVKAGDSKHGKAPVFAFNLRNSSFGVDPVMLVDPKAAHGVTVKGKSLRASAMAKHPITGHFYVVTSINRMLLVCDSQGNGLASFKLSKKKYPQPEGICFLPNGDMFISTEGLSKPAKLFRFNYMGTEIPAVDADSLKSGL